MSENVTHVAVCDDVVRLASRHDAIPAEFTAVLGDHLDVARLGAATRSADRWSAELIAWARDHWPQAGGSGPSGGPVDAALACKLAFVLGAPTHRAADRLMKPILDYAAQRYGAGAKRDATIHCDVLVFQEAGWRHSDPRMVEGLVAALVIGPALHPVCPLDSLPHVATGRPLKRDQTTSSGLLDEE